MIRNILFLFVSLFIGSALVTAQDNTVGLLSYQPSKVMDGYNLIYPHNQPNVYLLNNCGEVVHVWEGEEDFRPGNVAYILEDGRLLKTKRPASITEDAIWAGGGGATVELLDWDNNLMWSYTKNNEEERLHHDVAIKENGNVLMIIWEYKTVAEVIQAGRDTSTLVNGEMWPDKVVEINPSTSEIVWEWHTWDHLIQDFDSTKDNFGVVSDHPERIDINYDDNAGKADWMHTNAIDYDDERAQIILSVPAFHEVWIIDNTTSTEEAAGSTGGFGNRGGDLMYRWGNPAAHGNGTAEDQTLFYQHDVKFVNDFLSPSHPDFGKISCFNNRVGEDFSTANIFDPAWDMYKGTYTTIGGNQWGPEEFDLSIMHPTPTMMWSTGLSSFQPLSNGNYLICVGRFGYSFEITPENEIVWEYKTPIIGGAFATQGDELSINNNLTFRMTRYPADYEAFDNRNLEGQNFLELEPNEEFCDNILSLNNTPLIYDLDFYPNPASDFLTIEYNSGKEVDIRIFNLMGQELTSFTAMGGRKFVDISSWNEGVYMVEINKREMQKLIIQR